MIAPSYLDIPRPIVSVWPSLTAGAAVRRAQKGSRAAAKEDKAALPMVVLWKCAGGLGAANGHLGLVFYGRTLSHLARVFENVPLDVELVPVKASIAAEGASVNGVKARKQA